MKLFVEVLILMRWRNFPGLAGNAELLWLLLQGRRECALFWVRWVKIVCRVRCGAVHFSQTFVYAYQRWVSDNVPPSLIQT